MNEDGDLLKDLKPNINNFLFPLVLGNMTIRDFEALTCKVYDVITNELQDWADRGIKIRGNF